MDNPEECSVCFTTFDENVRRPRTLPCGHTFCSPCVGDMMKAGKVSCLGCRATHPATLVTQFPISYSTEALVKKLRALKLSQTVTMQEAVAEAKSGISVAEAGGISLKQSTRKLQSFLKEQKNSVSNLATDCQEVQCQLDQYRAQLKDWKIQHIDLLDRLNVLVGQNKEALQLLQQEDTRVLALKKEGEEGEKQLKVMLGCLQAVTTPQKIGSAINQADLCSEVAEDWKQKCHKLFPDVKIVTISYKVRENTQMALKTLIEESGATQDSATEPLLLDCQNSTIMEKVKEVNEVIDVTKFRKMTPLVMKVMEEGRLFEVQQDQNGDRFSKITLDDGRVYLHCLTSQPLPRHARTLPVSEVLGVVDPSSSLVFLDLGWGGSTRGRVHIRLTPDTPLARQFLLLCSGQRGPSYRNTHLLQVKNKGYAKEFLVGGDYQHNNGKGGAALLPHPEHQQYPKSCKAGSVFAWSGANDGRAQFAIIITNFQSRYLVSDVFGAVESGLKVVKAAINQEDITQVTVVDCGVVVLLASP